MTTIDNGRIRSDPSARLDRGRSVTDHRGMGRDREDAARHLPTERDAETTERDAEVFETARPTLMGVAYRVLGSTADAADAVQNTYLAWMRADKATIRSPQAWLITVCTRRALDLSTAANRARVDYIGTWLPDFVHTSACDDPGEHVALASSVTTAFMLLMERLTPRERAAYVLHEVFDRSYAEVAAALDLQEPACRQLVARARRNVGREQVRHRPAPERQAELLVAFRTAVAGGSTDALARLLSDDVVLTADSGGKVPITHDMLPGRRPVLEFIESVLGPYWRRQVVLEIELNAVCGLEVIESDRITTAVSFGFDDDGRVTDIFIMRNPDKLAALHDPDVLT